ncbi:hypothetical protein EON64_13910, partial [archaeon]
MLDSERGYRGERTEGLDFFVEHLPWKQLPREVFEAYGGYEQAKELRRQPGFAGSALKAAKDAASLAPAAMDSTVELAVLPPAPEHNKYAGGVTAVSTVESESKGLLTCQTSLPLL